MKLNLNTRMRLIKRQFDRFLSRKISNRLIVSYMSLGVLPLVIVSLVLISLTQDTLQTYIYEKNRETALRASNEILLFIREPLTILQTATLTRDAIEMDPIEQINLVNRLKEEYPIFRKVFILSDSGRVNATTRFGEENLNFRNDPFFIDGIQGKEYFSDVYFTQSRFPLMSIAEPIERFGQVVGVIVAEIELRSIWALVDNIPVGDTGFVFLLSREGRVIAHNNKDKVFEKEDYSRFEFFSSLKTEKELTTAYQLGEDTHVLVYESVPELNWGVVVQQSHREAFALATQMQKRVLYLTALTILIAAIIGLLGVQRFTKPLLTLVKGVREYGEGNLQHKIEMQTRDELAELAQEFNSMAKSLHKNQIRLRRMERLAALSRFASLVSHEIRNPLNAMNINMQILKKTIHKPDVAPERKIKYLDIISSEITRMNELVTNFLIIARPPELNMIRINIHELLEEVLLLHEAQATEKNIRIERSLTMEKPCGMLDYNQLKQVLHNIVVNAFDAMPDGGKLSVRTTIVEPGKSNKNNRRFVKMEFHDSGEGIPEEILQEVFEFYYTTKRAGSGLGLAIAKQIVQGHQGDVYIKSKIGEGTAVIIDLPIDQADQALNEN